MADDITTKPAMKSDVIAKPAEITAPPKPVSTKTGEDKITNLSSKYEVLVKRERTIIDHINQNSSKLRPEDIKVLEEERRKISTLRQNTWAAKNVLNAIKPAALAALKAILSE